jgi:hypothetical protein
VLPGKPLSSSDTRAARAGASSASSPGESPIPAQSIICDRGPAEPLARLERTPARHPALGTRHADPGLMAVLRVYSSNGDPGTFSRVVDSLVYHSARNEEGLRHALNLESLVARFVSPAQGEASLGRLPSIGLDVDSVVSANDVLYPRPFRGVDRGVRQAVTRHALDLLANSSTASSHARTIGDGRHGRCMSAQLPDGADRAGG